MVGAQHQAEVAAAAGVLGERGREAGDLLDGIEAGAALKFFERGLVGLRFERERRPRRDRTRRGTRIGRRARRRL